MAHVLHLNASPRGSASHSRQVSGEFVQAWLSAHPEDTVTIRDLGHQAVPHVSEEFIGAMYTPAEARTPFQAETLKLSDELIGELQAADIYVIGVPMYNFSAPSVFKSYIDQIARVGVTFTPSYEGLLKNKKVVFVTARGGGGYGPGEAREAYNFLDPYLHSVFAFVGVTDQTFIHINNTSHGDETAAALAAAREQIKSLVAA